MDDFEGCAWIIGILIAVALVVAVVVYIIVPVTLITIGSIATAGAGSGIYVASKNFGETFIEAHKTIK
jgi:hypothetical protein